MAGLSLEPRQGLPKDDRTQDTGIVSAQIPSEFQHQRRRMGGVGPAAFDRGRVITLRFAGLRSSSS